MRNAIRVAAVAVGLLVCAASATSYRNSYKETNLGNGVFMVVVEVNGHTSFATARQYAFQRASEVCGASGFVVGGADGNSYAPDRATTFSNVNVYGNSANGTSTTVLGGGGHDFTLVYACNSGYDGSRHGAAGGGGSTGGTSPDDLPRN